MKDIKELAQQLIEEKRVIKKGQWYYIAEGKIKLGCGKNGLAELSKRIESGEIKVDSTAGNQSDPVQTGNPSGPKSLSDVKETTPNYKSLVGKIKKIDPNKKAGLIDIYVNGVNVKLKDHPTIKACPLRFEWRMKNLNVANGDSQSNGEYTVFMKSWKEAAELKLSVSRDDTPEEDIYTIGELCLCCCLMEDHVEFRKRKQLQTLLAPHKSRQSRQNFANNMAQSEDIEQVIDGFKSQNTSDRKFDNDNLKSKGVSVADYEKKLANLDNINLDNAIEDAQNLVKAGAFGKAKGF